MSRRSLPDIDLNRCTGCGWCVAVCPPHVLSLELRNFKKSSVLHDVQACTGCQKCERRCPFGAITMVTGLQTCKPSCEQKCARP